MNPLSLLLFSLLVSLLVSSSSSSFSPSSKPTTVPDNYLVNCGTPESKKIEDGRTFQSDHQSGINLSTNEDIQVSVPASASSSSSTSSSSSIYRSARVFVKKSSYKFYISRPGRHWVRLHFFPLPNPTYKLSKAVFNIYTSSTVLLKDFSAADNLKFDIKEYLLNIRSHEFHIVFSPRYKSFAFINAIEIVSAPEEIIHDSASSVPPVGILTGVSGYDFELVYRLNVGSRIMTPKKDTLYRTWTTDEEFMKVPEGSKSVSVDPGTIKYPVNEAIQLWAPNWVYATAESINTLVPNYNLTWVVTVKPTFSYMLRMHYCDIISKKLGDLVFNVFLNGFLAVRGLDLSTVTSGLVVAYFKDFLIDASAIKNDSITIQIGPTSQTSRHALLNGLEVMKITQSGSLENSFQSYSWRNLALTAVLVMVFVVTSVFSFLRWRKRPQRRSHFDSRVFSFAELQKATQNFRENNQIGVGGFGKVYKGDLDNGRKIAIKRGNPRSEQGETEFQTEIEMLSKLRHINLVSLIGYCDEHSEMLLVYEYVENGTVRERLYDSRFPPLSWKERLEICIGAARGLDYLHTGAEQGTIIHRDIKTSNILLDNNLKAKVSDFGLSKAAPSLDQTHVSTAVKGTFGYLDPEYFKKNQLTTKSDVFSFGVVLFEVVYGRPVINQTLPKEQVSLAEWAIANHKLGITEDHTDPELSGTKGSDSLRCFVDTAAECLEDFGVNRPTMRDVLKKLEKALELHQAEVFKQMISFTNNNMV